MPWAEVRIDGGLPRRTPVELDVSTGAHHVVLDNSSLDRHEVIDLSVGAGGAKEIRRDWMP